MKKKVLVTLLALLFSLTFASSVFATDVPAGVLRNHNVSFLQGVGTPAYSNDNDLNTYMYVSGYAVYALDSDETITDSFIYAYNYGTSDQIMFMDSDQNVIKTFTIAETGDGMSTLSYKDYTHLPTAVPNVRYIKIVSSYNYIYEWEFYTAGMIVTVPTIPLNLTATGGNAKVDLSWNAVTGTDSYKIKRSTTPGGPYTEIVTGVTGTTYTDTTVTNGTTYYYVVTAVNTVGESGNSNEASATPQGQGPGTGGTGRAILVITLQNGLEKEYDLTMAAVNNFIAWYDAKEAGTGSGTYTIDKDFNKGPFLSRKDYIVFSKIMTFEVNRYE